MRVDPVTKSSPSTINSRLVFFDLETGGLNPKRHPIIQLAAVAVDLDLQPVEAFEAKVLFDEKRATQQALRKNHYSRQAWATEAREPHEVARDFSAFLRRHAALEVLGRHGKNHRLARLAAHNAAFDGPFLQAWYEKLGLFLPAHYRVLCTLQRAQWYFQERPTLLPPENYQLLTLCRHFGLPIWDAQLHEALADVLATIAVNRALREVQKRLPAKAACLRA